MNAKEQGGRETNQTSILLNYPQINGSGGIFSGKRLFEKMYRNIGINKQESM
jgi:hypothetical protein